MEKKERKLRWYKVTDRNDDLWYIFSAYSHSKAKIHYSFYSWICDDNFDALQNRCELVKEKLDIEPTEEGVIYPNDKELLEKWVFSEIIDY